MALLTMASSPSASGEPSLAPARDSVADDADALRRLREGDTSALSALLQVYEQPLLAFLNRFCGCEHTARDLCQDTFLKLIRKPPRRPTNGSLKPWLFRVARNLAIDALRRQSRIATGDIDNLPDAGVAHDPTIRSEVSQHLRQLPEKLRSVVTLRIYGDLTFNEIAQQLRIPLGTALWRMRRALELLRQAMEEQK